MSTRFRFTGRIALLLALLLVLALPQIAAAANTIATLNNMIRFIVSDFFIVTSLSIIKLLCHGLGFTLA